MKFTLEHFYFSRSPFLFRTWEFPVVFKTIWRTNVSKCVLSSALRIQAFNAIPSGKLDLCNIHVYCISCRLTMHGNLQEIRYGHTTTSLSMLMLQLSGFGLLGISHEKRNFVNLSNYINLYKKHQKKQTFQRSSSAILSFPFITLAAFIVSTCDVLLSCHF